MRDQLGPTPGICVAERDHRDRQRPVDRKMRFVRTDIPILSPNELLAVRPDRVLLTVPHCSKLFHLKGRYRSDNSYLQSRHHR